MLIEGDETHFSSPREAQAKGIATVYQDLALAPLMSVWRNFFLGNEMTKGPFKSLDIPAMQMAFRVANPAWLQKLQVGDKVTFEADKVGGQFTVTAIDVRK